MSPRLNKEALSAISRKDGIQRFVRVGEDIFYGPGGEGYPYHKVIYDGEMKDAGITDRVSDAGYFNKDNKTILLYGDSSSLGIGKVGWKREQTAELIRSIASPKIKVERF